MKNIKQRVEWEFTELKTGLSVDVIVAPSLLVWSRGRNFPSLKPNSTRRSGRLEFVPLNGNAPTPKLPEHHQSHEEVPATSNSWGFLFLLFNTTLVTLYLPSIKQLQEHFAYFVSFGNTPRTL